MSAKYRQTNLHANKTDALDCSHIAKAYYGDEKLHVFEKQEDRFIVLQRLNRMYEDELQHLRKRTVAFRSTLDIIYPRLDKCFNGKASLYDPVIMEILKKYPHPKLLLKHKEETIAKAIERKIFVLLLPDRAWLLMVPVRNSSPTNTMANPMENKKNG